MDSIFSARSDFTFPIIGLVVVAVFFLLVVIILVVRRGQTSSRNSLTMAMDLELERLKTVNLTPEERAKIRAAQMRRLQKTLDQPAPKGPVSPELLLMADPEVQALEEAARNKKLQAQASTISTKPVEAPSEELPELPEDVLKMAQLGLITEEELMTIRLRLAEKRRNQLGG